MVEDNPVNLVIALEMLRSLGVETLEAENGAVAIERSPSIRSIWC